MIIWHEDGGPWAAATPAARPLGTTTRRRHRSPSGRRALERLTPFDVLAAAVAFTALEPVVAP